MEEKMFQLFKMANQITNKQDKLYVQIIYTSGNDQNLEILLRSKQDFSYIEKMNIQLNNYAIIKLNKILEILSEYSRCDINDR